MEVCGITMMSALLVLGFSVTKSLNIAFSQGKKQARKFNVEEMFMLARKTAKEANKVQGEFACSIT